MRLAFTEELIITNHFDRECALLADRHYSRQNVGSPQFGGNGSKLVLRDALGLCVFVWLFQQNRFDGQEGRYCAMFHNESQRLSSEIILEAETFAVEKWGAGRAFTFVDANKIRSTNPGCCFKKAGWRFVGYSKKRRKMIFAKMLS